MNRTSTAVACAAGLVMALLVTLPGAAGAADAADDDVLIAVKHLVREGRYDQALPRIEAFLVANPGHAEARFLKGLVLVEQGRSNDALIVFQGLVRDYPSLPEPHNNLAVLYAARGDYDKARESLLLAIETHPSYATAHENLGDIYARMAGIAYGDALEIDIGNDTARAKLELVHELFSARGPGGRRTESEEPVPRHAPVEQVAEVSTEVPVGPEFAVDAGAGAPGTDPEPGVVAPQADAAAAAVADGAVGRPTGEAAGEAQAGAQPPAAPVTETTVAQQGSTTDAGGATASPVLESTTIAAEPTVDVVVASARDASGVTEAQAAEPGRLMEAARDMLSAWARAWSEQDFDAYLTFYDERFEPSAGLSKPHWEIQRRTRVTGPDFIEIRLEDVDIDLVDDHHASVIFSQVYRSDSFRDTVRKAVTLFWNGSAWKITSETALD